MSKKLYTVLSIDGGGIRGIVPARILAEIELRLGHPIGKSFDLMAGTSTGGIIALGMAAPCPKDPSKPRFKADDLVKLYEERGPEIFRKSWFDKVRSLVFGPRYDNKSLKDSLREYFGNTRLDQALTSVIVPAYDIEKREAVFMRHLKNNDREHTDRRWRMRDAALATSSAPTYFEPVRTSSFPAENPKPGDTHEVQTHTLIDGGVFANNPASAAYIAAQKIKPEDSEVFMLSIGTGRRVRKYPYESARRWGALHWINPGNDLPVLSAAMDGQSTAANYHMNFVLGDEQIRIDAPLLDAQKPGQSPSDEMDDASPQNIARLNQFADRVIEMNSDKLDRMVEVLRARLAQPGPAPGESTEPRPREDVHYPVGPDRERGLMDWLGDLADRYWPGGIYRKERRLAGAPPDIADDFETTSAQEVNATPASPADQARPRDPRIRNRERGQAPRLRMATTPVERLDTLPDGLPPDRAANDTATADEPAPRRRIG